MKEKNDISDMWDIFETDENAPDCFELSALFFVYIFLFGDEQNGVCDISENIKK